MSCSTCSNNAGLHNIVADQGATYKCTVVYSNAAKKPYDVTGYTARMHVRSAVASEDIIISLTSENGRIIVGTTDGRFDLYISAADTTLLPADKYVYDLEVIAPVTGIVERLMMGNFVVRGEVTR